MHSSVKAAFNSSHLIVKSKRSTPPSFPRSTVVPYGIILKQFSKQRFVYNDRSAAATCLLLLCRGTGQNLTACVDDSRRCFRRCFALTASNRCKRPSESLQKPVKRGLSSGSMPSLSLFPDYLPSSMLQDFQFIFLLWA